MTRLLIHVEGETEETFVNEALAPHLYNFGYNSVSARLLGNSRSRSRRGGIRGWSTVRGDVVNHLNQDKHCLATTMVDYYALPQTGPKAWPGRAEAGKRSFPEKAALVQNGLLEDLMVAMGKSFNPRRFIPYVMMHEFEALLFSDCKRFASAIGQPQLANDFQAIRDAFDTPEEINDHPLSAPSKRVQAMVKGYTKPFLGTIAVLEIGFETIRQECPQFRAWIKQLERFNQYG